MIRGQDMDAFKLPRGGIHPPRGFAWFSYAE